jgi:hydrogenase maturation protein HypF
MVATLAQARALAVVNEQEAEALTSPARPIVLLEPRESSIAGSVCSGLGTVGIMLAYTPLHLLLLEAAGRPLVMTSGNRSETPIATDNDDAITRLAGVADGFLLHDREIITPCDDSVVRVVAGVPRFLRRARGFAPLHLPLPVPSPVPLLAVGPHLKNTFTLVHGDRAWVSPHIVITVGLQVLAP